MSTVVSHVENGIPMDEPENAKAVAEDLDRQRTSLAERLRLAHADAVSQIEDDRGRPGQLSTGINGEVGVSILNAGVRWGTQPFRSTKAIRGCCPACSRGSLLLLKPKVGDAQARGVVAHNSLDIL